MEAWKQRMIRVPTAALLAFNPLHSNKLASAPHESRPPHHGNPPPTHWLVVYATGEEDRMQRDLKAARSNRGFASMDAEKQREIARKGGRSVPNEKRSFSQNHQLASEAGRKGGQSSHTNRLAPSAGEA